MEDKKPQAETTEGKKPTIVDKLYALIKGRKPGFADEFLQMPYVQQAKAADDDKKQRELVNHQLRLHLGRKEEDTSIARLALDDRCPERVYLAHFRRYTLAQL
jgi:hypothetical protein